MVMDQWGFLCEGLKPAKLLPHLWMNLKSLQSMDLRIKEQKWIR
jgi:hypothetical protein